MPHKAAKFVNWTIVLGMPVSRLKLAALQSPVTESHNSRSFVRCHFQLAINSQHSQPAQLTNCARNGRESVVGHVSAITIDR
jgi:hypothetical protein